MNHLNPSGSFLTMLILIWLIVSIQCWAITINIKFPPLNTHQKLSREKQYYWSQVDTINYSVKLQEHVIPIQITKVQQSGKSGRNGNGQVYHIPHRCAPVAVILELPKKQFSDIWFCFALVNLVNLLLSTELSEDQWGTILRGSYLSWNGDFFSPWVSC